MNSISKISYPDSVNSIRQEKDKSLIVDELPSEHIKFNSSGETLNLIPELIKPVQCPVAGTIHALRKLSRS